MSVAVDDMAHNLGPPRDMAGCVKATCAGVQCGIIPDNCGSTVNCYTYEMKACGMGQKNGTCAGNGTPYTCEPKGSIKCMPKTQGDCLPSQCGLIIRDGCTDVVYCPPCP
jgi:hypothetical protein